MDVEPRAPRGSALLSAAAHRAPRRAPQVKFRLDLVGTYAMRITYRGKQLEFYDGELNIGTHINGSPYAIVIKPAEARGLWSTATGAPPPLFLV